MQTSGCWSAPQQRWFAPSRQARRWRRRSSSSGPAPATRVEGVGQSPWHHTAATQTSCAHPVSVSTIDTQTGQPYILQGKSSVVFCPTDGFRITPPVEAKIRNLFRIKGSTGTKSEKGERGNRRKSLRLLIVGPHNTASRIRYTKMKTLAETIAWYKSDFNDKFKAFLAIFNCQIMAAALIHRGIGAGFSFSPRLLTIDELPFDLNNLFTSMCDPGSREFNLTQNIRAAKRMLLADAFDQLTESFCRCYDAVANLDGQNPYETASTVWYVSSKLYKGSKGAQYFTDDEKKYFRNFMAPIRDAIRHNNAFIPANNEMAFHATIHGVRLDLDIKKGMVIDARLPVAIQVFGLNQMIGNLAFDRLLASFTSSET